MRSLLFYFSLSLTAVLLVNGNLLHMNQDKLFYWGLVIFTILIVALGIWVCFFSKPIIEKRAKLAENRLGPKAVVFFIGTLRVLGTVLLILSMYLLINLFQILPCALK